MLLILARGKAISPLDRYIADSGRTMMYGTPSTPGAALIVMLGEMTAMIASKIVTAASSMGAVPYSSKHCERGPEGFQPPHPN